MRISDWSSDVCSSDLSIARVRCPIRMAPRAGKAERRDMAATKTDDDSAPTQDRVIARLLTDDIVEWRIPPGSWLREREIRSEEHTSELQSLMRISYAVFCLTKHKRHN